MPQHATGQLAECCRSNGHEVCVADTLRLPYRTASFDAGAGVLRARAPSRATRWLPPDWALACALPAGLEAALRCLACYLVASKECPTCLLPRSARATKLLPPGTRGTRRFCRQAKPPIFASWCPCSKVGGGQTTDRGGTRWGEDAWRRKLINLARKEPLPGTAGGVALSSHSSQSD